jgi:sulfite reductase (ferredoxin)
MRLNVAYKISKKWNINMTEPTKKLSAVEGYKLASEHLKGNISAELADNSSDQVSDETYELLKFHGSYFGYDRDSATIRKKAGLDKEYEFMVRMKCPGGRLTAAQYVALDLLAEKYANGTLRITTRETFQFHCI